MFPAACLAYSLRLQQVCFTASQRLFRALASCHIQVGTNVFDNISGFIENQVSDPVDVLYRAIRQHDPVILHKISLRA
jgi:hypothetical protein